VGVLHNTEVLLGWLVGWLIYHESPSILALLGGLAIVTSGLVIFLGPRPNKKAR